MNQLMPTDCYARPVRTLNGSRIGAICKRPFQTCTLSPLDLGLVATRGASEVNASSSNLPHKTDAMLPGSQGVACADSSGGGAPPSPHGAVCSNHEASVTSGRMLLEKGYMQQLNEMSRATQVSTMAVGHCCLLLAPLGLSYLPPGNEHRNT